MDGSYATSAVTRTELAKRFDKAQISKLPATAKKPAIDYVNHAVVTDRLNTAVPGWTMSQPEVIVSKGEDGGVFVLASMTIDGITRWEFGEGSDPKRALSDWIKRAAMRFGVALDLWAKNELESAAEERRGSSAAGVQREQESLDGRAAGGPGEKVAIASGEGATDTTPGSPSLATTDQWDLLISAVVATMDDTENSRSAEKKIVNKLNKANKSGYTTLEQAKRLATIEQLEKALAEV